MRRIRIEHEGHKGTKAQRGRDELAADGAPGSPGFWVLVVVRREGWYYKYFDADGADYGMARI